MGEQAAEAAPEAKAPVEKKRSLLHRIPTPLIVTLLGIALTAWLLPAFTRQWDDRQKSHELKSEIVSEIAASSAQALLGGEAVWNKQRVNRRAVAERWSLANLKIQARLHAYFDQPIVDAWRVYAWMIARFAGSDPPMAEEGLLAAYPTAVYHSGGQPAHLSRAASANAKEVMLYAKFLPYIFASKHILEQQAVDRLMQQLGISDPNEYIPGHFRNVEYSLLLFEGEIVDEVLAAHVSGYSTTTHDLLHDLTP